MSIPFFFHLIGPYQHQYFPVFGIRIIRKKDHHTIFLCDSAQPKQIGVLFEWIKCVTIHRHFIIADKDGDGIFFHLADKALPVFDENFRVQWKYFMK